MVSKGQFLGLDRNRIVRLHSQVMEGTHMNSLTASRCQIKAYLDAAWGSEFFPEIFCEFFFFLPIFYI